MKTDRTALLSEIMADFARRTGLDPESKGPRRYLWTDAFAVCNYLEAHRLTGEEKWRDLALRLVHQVHHTLGRHRSDDSRKGWISGLSEAEGERHPTGGGLRIGKEIGERGPAEPLDERREWDRDGQYFHYLTKWMHALRQVYRATGEGNYLLWARELAQAAYQRFSFTPAPGAAKRLHWKMSIDLSRPQVPSTGQHDALDGLVTYSELQEAGGSEGATQPQLASESAEFAEMCRGQYWETEDTLGIGGLLFDAARIGQLIAAGSTGPMISQQVLGRVLDAAVSGLEVASLRGVLSSPAAYRLAFRELGLSIGLHAVELLQNLAQEHRQKFDDIAVSQQISSLKRHLPLAEKIENFWIDHNNRSTHTWTDHQDINAVMLATSLAPDTFITL